MKSWFSNSDLTSILNNKMIPSKVPKVNIGFRLYQSLRKNGKCYETHFLMPWP